MRKCCGEIPGYHNWNSEVWRILLEPNPYNSQLHPSSLQHCLLENVVGVGWRLDSSQGEPKCFDDYKDKLADKYPGETSPLDLGKLKPGDLVWVMAKPDKKGHCPPGCPPLLDYGFSRKILYIGLAIGFWEYRNEPLAQLTEMFSVVPVLFRRAFVISDEGVEDWGDFKPDAGDEQLVGQLKDRFNMPGTVQPIRTSELIDFSKRVWCQLVYRQRAVLREIPGF